MRLLFSIVAVAVLCILSGARTGAQASDTEEILVVARRSGAPVWTATLGERKLVLVGGMRDLPDGTQWNVEALEAAAARVDRVLLPVRNDVSLGDILRLTTRFRTAGYLPKGTTSADYLPPALQDRLTRRMQSRPIADWRKRSFVFLGIGLLKQAGHKREGWAGAKEVARAARKQGVPAMPLDVVPGKQLVDALLSQSPAAYASCIEAALGAAEAGPDIGEERAAAWAKADIAAVLSNPLDVALSRCWPSGDPAVGERLRNLWLAALLGDGADRETLLALAPLRILAEPGGVLDVLEAQGYAIEGPVWPSHNATREAQVR